MLRIIEKLGKRKRGRFPSRKKARRYLSSEFATVPTSVCIHSRNSSRILSYKHIYTKQILHEHSREKHEPAKSERYVCSTFLLGMRTWTITKRTDRIWFPIRTRPFPSIKKNKRHLPFVRCHTCLHELTRYVTCKFTKVNMQIGCMCVHGRGKHAGSWAAATPLSGASLRYCSPPPHSSARPLPLDEHPLHVTPQRSRWRVWWRQTIAQWCSR